MNHLSLYENKIQKSIASTRDVYAECLPETLLLIVDNFDRAIENGSNENLLSIEMFIIFQIFDDYFIHNQGITKYMIKYGYISKRMVDLEKEESRKNFVRRKGARFGL